MLPKLVERAPREAVKMLSSYPDEFVVGMLTCLILRSPRMFSSGSQANGARKSWRLLHRRPANSGHEMRITRRKLSAT